MLGENPSVSNDRTLRGEKHSISITHPILDQDAQSDLLHHTSHVHVPSPRSHVPEPRADLPRHVRRDGVIVLKLVQQFLERDRGCSGGVVRDEAGEDVREELGELLSGYGLQVA